MRGVAGRVKRYVTVNVDVSEDGSRTPRSVTWRNGEVFSVDRVIDCRRAASLKTGGRGMRYAVVVRGRQTYLWEDEEGRWFVEEKIAEMP